VSDGRVVGVELDAGPVEADAVVFTGALPVLGSLLPDGLSDPLWAATGSLGVLCVVLELRRRLSDVYWTNVCDPALPFGGVIEHTNLMPASDYGCHVVYLSRYFTHDEAVAGADVDAEAARWVALLAERFGLSGADVLRVHPFRTGYAAPLVTLGHLAPVASHIPGLVVSTTAQIYPQDRGMSEGVRMGNEAARAALAAPQPAGTSS